MRKKNTSRQYKAQDAHASESNQTQSKQLNNQGNKSSGYIVPQKIPATDRRLKINGNIPIDYL